MPACSRRSFIALLGGSTLGLPSCTAAERTASMPSSLPPWHLWGNNINVELVATATPFTLAQNQLAKVSYGRPESWNFFMWCKVLQGAASGLLPGVIQARFNLTIGVGRTSFTIDDFLVMIFTPTLPTTGQRIWKTSTVDPDSVVVSDFVAQDIQLNTNCIITGGAAPGSRIVIEVGAMFAPKTHNRPEWFRREFSGGEDNGT